MTQGALRPVLSVLMSGAVAAGLVGCSTGEDDPAPTAVPVVVEEPAPPPDPEPTPEPEPTPPRPTAAMDTPDRAGAEAAAMYFVELLTHVLASGDVGDWKRASGQSCVFCASVEEEVDRVYGAGGRFVGGELQAVHLVEQIEFEADFGIHHVVVEFELGGGEELDADGAQRGTFEPTRSVLLMELAPAGPGRWIVIGAAMQDGSS